MKSQRKRVRWQHQALLRLAADLTSTAAAPGLPAAYSVEAAMLANAATRAATILAKAIVDAAAAREAAYETRLLELAAGLPEAPPAFPVKRPSARAHPWRSRAVVPARPKGVQ